MTVFTIILPTDMNNFYPYHRQLNNITAGFKFGHQAYCISYWATLLNEIPRDTKNAKETRLSWTIRNSLRWVKVLAILCFPPFSCRRQWTLANIQQNCLSRRQNSFNLMGFLFSFAKCATRHVVAKIILPCSLTWGQIVAVYLLLFTRNPSFLF